MPYETCPADRATAPLAVVDIGSNTGRVTVLRLEHGAHLTVLADADAPLRLIRDVVRERRIGEAAMQRTLAALRRFAAVARAAGATRTVAVATSAVREAANGADLLSGIWDATSIRPIVVDGEREGLLGFLGAVHSLPVQAGYVLDLGGGSLQLTRFRDRRPERSWSLPLGALRLSDLYLESDPPSAAEIDALQRHVRSTIRQSEIPPLGADEVMVGTGGTIRTLAKIDRRVHGARIPRLHGYVLAQRRVSEVADMVTTCPLEARPWIPGLKAERADSIAGGALTVLATMELLACTSLVVSGHGLREGVALDTLLDRELPDVPAVRAASLQAVGGRFATWQPAVSEARARLGKDLLAALDPRADTDVRAALHAAASLLDVGRSVDFYNHQAHSARIVAGADLAGYSHPTLALICSAISASERKAARKSEDPALAAIAHLEASRLAAILGLADGLLRTLPREDWSSLGVERRNGILVVHGAPSLRYLRDEAQAVERAFDVRLEAAAEHAGRPC